uniref:HTH_48 domain-containing protein n=1 Tax=Steinernema glaseri TaxID=37863 RepID=A0A1I7XVU7_9BILA
MDTCWFDQLDNCRDDLKRKAGAGGSQSANPSSHHMFLFILTLIGCNSVFCEPPKELSARRRRHMHKVPTASLPHDDAAAIAQLLEENWVLEIMKWG